MRLIALLIVSGLSWLGFQVMTPFNPAFGNTQRFERHFDLSGDFPYLRRYHLFQPDILHDDERLPLIVVLHGASQKSVFSMAFADPQMQAHTRAFVLAPDAALRRQWATPRAPGWIQGAPEELDWAIAVTRDIAARYPIDRDRIYIVGASQGGVGVFGALARHPGLFAAGLSWAGAWDAHEAGALDRARVWALHGQDDQIVPPRYSAETTRAIHHLGGDARLTLISDVGHGFHTGPQMEEAIGWLLETRRAH